MRPMLLALVLAACVACGGFNHLVKHSARPRPSTDFRYVCVGFTASWCDETLSATVSSGDVPMCGVVQMLTSPPKHLPDEHHRQPPCQPPIRKYQDLPAPNEHPV